MSKIFRAISIRQPFAELILMGKKKFENRSTLTNIRERVYLYASMQQGGSEAQLKQTGKTFEKLPKGIIVGSVEIIDCRETEDGYAYKLANPKRI
ncbi:MAG: ASCH domain-containing protein [Chryseolinea sp.]